MSKPQPFVLHLTTVHPRFDLRIFGKQCLSLKREGYDVHLLVADGRGDEVRDGIIIHDLGRPSGRVHRMTELPLCAVAAIRRLKPSLVHFHDPELLPAALCLRLAGYTVVYDAHEDLPRSIKSRRWLRQELLGVVSRFAEWTENACASAMSAVVGATPHIAARFAKRNRNVIAVCNYPDLLNVPEMLNREPEPATFCYVGAISRHRGIIEIVRATGNVGAKLLLAGPFGDDQLQAQVAAMPEWQNVEYFGVLPHEQVWGLMRRSQAGLLFLHLVPNYVDSLPVKLFEYMAAGLPVLSSDYPGWPDIVKDNGIGLTCDPADAEAIAGLMRQILADPDRAQAMGSYAREAVVTRYSWKGEAEKLIDLYRKLLPAPTADDAAKA
jgi:glycosyltransferase involved in cell wall biosynthesis